MIISVFNQKGGIGKSTTTTCLAAALAKLGHKTLVVDMDAQANSTVGLGINDEALTHTVYDLLKDMKAPKESIYKIIQPTGFVNLSILPSDISLSNAEITLANTISRETILLRILEKIKDDFEFIFIDCPPSLGLLSINSLVASDRIIVPLTPGYFSTKGIKHLLDTVNLVRDNLKPGLDILGVLITKYDARKKLDKDLLTEIRAVFGDKTFKTFIRVDSQIEYAQEHSKPVIYFAERSKGTKDYIALAHEVIEYDRRK